MSVATQLKEFKDRTISTEKQVQTLVDRLQKLEASLINKNKASEEEVVEIYKVTEVLPEDKKDESDMKCPVTIPKESNGSTNADEDEDEESDPSLKEYKKMKRVMKMITRFYEGGSRMKKDNYETMTGEIAKLDLDLDMVKSQLESLQTNPIFKRHPKRKEYEKNLQEELEGLLQQRKKFEEKQKHYFELSEWSKKIVEVCKWLELNMDDYAVNELKLPLKIKMTPLPKLSEKDAEIYSKGLAEITYNLQESQDFFEASVDGRLRKYHNIEKNIILAQLETIRKYPEDNPRRQYIEAELLKDLEFVENNMKETPEAMDRRHKMLENHREFFRVLSFHKKRLKKLGIDDSHERKYDPQYDHYQDE